MALVGPAIADAPAPAKAVEVIFFGYQMLNGRLAVQIHISGVAAADQPGRLKTGDPFNLGPLGVYTVGTIHPFPPLPPGVGPGRVPVPLKAATVELIDASGHKTTLQFRKVKEIKAQPGTLTDALPAHHPRAAPA